MCSLKFLIWYIFGAIVMFSCVLFWTELLPLRFVSHTNTLGSRKASLKVASTKFCKIYDLSKPTKSRFPIHCKKATKYNPSMILCLYPPGKDIFMSNVVENGGIWEEQLHFDIKLVLLKDPTLNFIDIGANIGTHSIYVANMGRKVVCVEPVDENLIRLQNSVMKNGLQDKVTLVQNAVSSNRKNISMTYFGDKDKGVSKNQGQYMVNEQTKGNLGAIYMDDLLEVITFNRCVIKIDIEGNEHKAFSHASELLKKVYVPVIFMEFVFMRRFAAKPKSEDYRLLINMLHMFEKLHYVPYGYNSKDRLDYNNWPNWANGDVKFVLSNATNLN